jgi:4-amino-4-deoxy-L-arabinose transferase-like glycosyltransferase
LLTALAEIWRDTPDHFRPPRSTKQLVAMLVVVGVYLLLALYRLGWADLGPDEARFGVAAVNLMTDFRQLAILSEDPLGSPGSEPFVYAVCVAASFRALGKNEFTLRVVSVAALLGAGLLISAAVAAFVADQWLSVLTLVFFLLNPWTISYARTAMPEPTLVFWGSLAVFTAVRFSKTRSPGWAFACGMALGLAFLTKVWLVLPFAVAALIIFSGMFIFGPSHRTLVAALVAFCAFIVTSSSHLLLVLWLAPVDLQYWLHHYFGYALASRAAGQGYDPAMWFHPWWFYLAGLFKATFFGLPVVYLAIYTLIRRGERDLVAVLAAMLSLLLILSLFRVKQTSYAYPAFPAVAFLLAYGTLVAVRTRPVTALVVATVLSAATASFFFSLGVITPTELYLIGGLYSLYIIASLATEQYRLVIGVAVAGSALTAMLAADIVAVRTSLQHRTYYREIAAYLHPLVAHSAPQTLVFQAPEFSSLEFYLFRTGEYWQTYYFHESYDAFLDQLKRGGEAFYVVDPAGTVYGGKISTEKLDALHQYAMDETSQVERAIGRKLRLQVFVSSAWSHQHSQTDFVQHH